MLRVLRVQKMMFIVDLEAFTMVAVGVHATPSK